MNFDLINNLSAYFSQSTETLYEYLTSNLFSPEKPPFTKRILLVPSPLMKSWLTKKMADDLGIAMGIELFLLEKGMKKIAELMGISTPVLVPSVDQLSFAFQLLIPKLADDYPFLKSYLTEGHEKRLRSLAKEMAQLFADYGIYGESLLEKWNENPKHHWQAALWKLIRENFPQWGPAYQRYSQRNLTPLIPFEIHLFAISFLPATIIRFLESLSVPIYFYHLSPTQTFWEDTLTGSQRRFMTKVLEKKGVSEAQLTDLDTYLRNTHPLLSNWGKLGRMMVKQLPSDLHAHEECYPLPESLFQMDEWEEHLYPETRPSSTPLTLLTRLQADLVTMRPSPSTPSDCVQDHTLQVHKMSSKRREVEEIYNILMGIIDRHKNDTTPIAPEDIVVMAPDIMEYAPYIESHFGRNESALEYRLMDIALPMHDPCIRAVRKILSLIGSRWESSSLKDLLHSELLQKKLGIEVADVAKLQRWIEDNDVIWGMDKTHHAESLLQSHCREGIEIHQGTWDHFFERTLRGLVTTHEEGVELKENDILPYPNIELNDAELLGKWIGMLQHLYRELKQMESTETTLFEWSKILEALSIQFLGSLSEEMERIFIDLRQLATPFENQKFPFAAVLEWFDLKFQNEKTSYREHHINSVRFCSLLPMRAIPAKVIVLCGMSDGAFPRLNIETSQNCLKAEANADLKPREVDFDRYLMLETILSTRGYLVFTYSSREQNSGPSLIINELLDLLDRYYTIDSVLPSQSITYNHAFHRYDPRYFQNSILKSYSMSSYKEAEAFANCHKAPLSSFIPKFEVTAVETLTEEIVLSLKELERLAKSPLEFYYKQSLGIRLEKENEVKTERSLTLHSIDKAVIPRKSIRTDLNENILRAKKEGKIPEGILGEISVRTIESQTKELKEKLLGCNIDLETIYDYTFDKIVFSPPGLPKIILSGTIENVTPEGLILHKGKNEMEVIYTNMPKILLFHYLVKEQLIAAKPVIHFSETGKSKPLTNSNPKESIELYLCYWNQARVNPSPLMPKWIPFLLNNDPESLSKRFNNSFETIYDEYEKANTKFDVEHLMVAPWIELAERIHNAPL